MRRIITQNNNLSVVVGGNRTSSLQGLAGRKRWMSTLETPTQEASVDPSTTPAMPDVNTTPTVLENDLAELINTKPTQELSGKFVRIGQLFESYEIPRQFEKTEWNTKMLRRGQLTPEEIKKLGQTVPARGGRWDVPSLVPENERHVMLRSKSIDLCKEMAQLNEGGSGKSFAKVIVGQRGVGKSSTLISALAYARSAGWLTMYLPKASDLVTEIGAYFSGTAGPIAVLPESNIGQGLFQQPNAGKEILELTDAMHGEVLALLPQRRQYKHDLYKPKEGKQATLAHILMRGLAQPHRAADALYDLRMEFNLVKEVPVLIAIDEFNALYWPTSLFFQSKSIKAHQLVVAKAFRFVKQVPGDIEDGAHRKDVRRARLVEEHLPVRGVLLGAVTNSLDAPPHKEQIPPARFEHFDIEDVAKVEPERYTKDEISTMLNWYQMRGACRPQSQADHGTCRVFTAGVGEKVAKYALGSTIGL